MMASDPHDRLQRAIALIQAGRPDEARSLLEAIVAADPGQEIAWLWLATVSTNRAERIAFLERVLALNPANDTARAAYARLTGQPPATPVPSATASSRPAMTPGGLLIVMAVIAVAVAAVLIALYLRDSDDNAEDASPEATLISLETLTPTSLFSPTPSDTPRPSVTPGPSPTLVWDSALPTWTPAPSLTAAPAREVATWTPRPPSATPTEAPRESATARAPDLTAEVTEAAEERTTPVTGRN